MSLKVTVEEKKRVGKKEEKKKGRWGGRQRRRKEGGEKKRGNLGGVCVCVSVWCVGGVGGGMLGTRLNFAV